VTAAAELVLETTAFAVVGVAVTATDDLVASAEVGRAVLEEFEATAGDAATDEDGASEAGAEPDADGASEAGAEPDADADTDADAEGLG